MTNTQKIKKGDLVRVKPGDEYARLQFGSAPFKVELANEACVFTHGFAEGFLHSRFEKLDAK